MNDNDALLTFDLYSDITVNDSFDIYVDNTVVTGDCRMLAQKTARRSYHG